MPEENEGSGARREGRGGWTRTAGWLAVLLVGVLAACSDLVTEPRTPGAAAWRDETGSSCGNGFTQAQCDAIEDAIEYLKNHPDWECQHMGQEAETRFQNGDMFHYDNPNEFGDSGDDGTTGLTDYAFEAGELANTIAHEEAHHHGYEDLNNGSGTDAYAVGNKCDGPI